MARRRRGNQGLTIAKRSYGYRCARIIALLTLALLAGCGDGSRGPAPSYDQSALEAQVAAQALIDEGSASAISVALVDANRILWTRSAGLADREAGRPATDETIFGVGSVAKMFATIAVMKLVDRGVVELDAPLVRYVPSFRMASDGWQGVTVRMLLNHSAGFPGTDYRHVEETAPHAGYVDQVLQTLAMSRLKAPPGYMSVYCNDCFTLTEALVRETSGKSYEQFVHDEILGPLGMRSTRYTTSALPAGSYAKAYVNGVAQPQEFVSALATGGVFTTSRDLASIAMMFLGQGAVGGNRILSSGAVAAMGVDQTVGQFNPIRSNAWAYGLGWDSVAAPGLTAVGFDGWHKGGDVMHYGAVMVVSPKAGLGVVVMGAPGFGSNRAGIIAERVLLRALAENGRIAAFPTPIVAAAAPVATAPPGLVEKAGGVYATDASLFRLQPQPDGSLHFLTHTDDGWSTLLTGLKYRADGWLTSDLAPLQALKAVDAGGAQYLVRRRPGGFGHYLDTEVLAQKVESRSADLSPAWSARLTSTWLVVNESPNALPWPTMDPRLRLATLPELRGLVAVRPPMNPGWHVVDPSGSDTLASMMLITPQLNGRDLDDLNIEPRGGAEWVRWGGYRFRPLAQVPLLAPGSDTVVTIGPEGHAEWRALPSASTATAVAITTVGAWRLFDPGFRSVASGTGNGVASLPPGAGPGYVMLFGAPGQTLRVALR